MSAKGLREDMERVQAAMAAVPGRDGTFYLITYRDWNYEESVTVTLETQPDGSVRSTCSKYDDEIIVESYSDAWLEWCEAEEARLSDALYLAEIAEDAQ